MMESPTRTVIARDAFRRKGKRTGTTAAPRPSGTRAALCDGGNRRGTWGVLVDSEISPAASAGGGRTARDHPLPQGTRSRAIVDAATPRDTDGSASLRRAADQQ